MKKSLRAIMLEPQTANAREAKRNQLFAIMLMVAFALVLISLHLYQGG
ncbi:MAG TPA: hypothetical protein PKE26_01080 [Kiritimatiellia bacterium]|nr:hypothetical protein [Kiritimatiellia bacterium]HMO97686.1 hypothetical protein [Kiritimatiellia bacterium]